MNYADEQLDALLLGLAERQIKRAPVVDARLRFHVMPVDLLPNPSKASVFGQRQHTILIGAEQKCIDTIA